MATPGTAELSPAQKRLVLIAAILGTATVAVDATIVNVALPAISDDLGGGLAGQQWVVNAYTLALGSLLLVGGSLGDLYGERRVFSLGVIGFGVFSLVCALAPTVEVLIAARALQGVAGALLTPSTLAIIVMTFSERERGSAIGSWTAWGGIATVIGPLAGGQIVDSVSWRWIFAVNVPLVALTLALIFAAVPARPRGPITGRIDVVGAILCATGLAGPTFALIEQPRLGWGDPLILGLGLGGIVLFTLFVLWERRTSSPMLPLALFTRRNFTIGNVETFSMYAGLGVLFFLLILFLQQVAGFSALKAGFSTLPVTIVMFLLSKRAGALADRFGPRFFMGAGPLIAAAGLALFLRIDENVTFVTGLLPALLVFSLGLSLTVSPLTATVLADADQHNAGVASAVNNAIARVAGLLATAAVGAVVASQFSATLDTNLGNRPLDPATAAVVSAAKDRSLSRVDPATIPPADRELVATATTDASVSAFHDGIAIVAALVALGGLLGAAGIRDPRRGGREVSAEGCAGGQFAGSPRDAARPRPGPVPSLPRTTA